MALAIDAPDELSSRGEGDAVDVVLEKPRDLDYPRFVLTCRATDWRNATAVAGLEEFHGEKKILVAHL